MRCFIAIDIDEKIRTAIDNLQQDLAGAVDIKKGDVKWVKPQRMHLTLKFLGEVKDKRIIDVCRAVEEVVGRHAGFELDIKNVGYFGGKSARVLWAGTGDGSDNLGRLQKDIEKQLALAGWDEEKREFAGHLTLCRVRNSKAGVKLAQISEDYKDLRLGTIRADSVSVYQSQLKPAGPVYTILASYKLTGIK